MQEVLITFKASRNIIKQSRQCDVETGGILVGTLQPITIVDAGSPGENAIHRAAQFTSDPETDKAHLAQAREQFGEQIRLVGWWHKHPAGFIRPSSGDCSQAMQLAGEYNDGLPVLMGIVNRPRKSVRHKTTLHLYSIDPEGELMEYEWKLISCSNNELLDAIRKAPIAPELTAKNYWTDSDFQFYLNPIGRERIKRELKDLKKAGWYVQTARRKQDKALVLDTLMGLNKLCLVLPPEFPINPPTVFTAEGRQFMGLETLSQWNSHHRLSEVVAEAAAVLRCSRCSKQCIEGLRNVRI
jgi:proteasome lid subunit RPN8/RPN11